ncbi:MAG: hypothetical protein RSD41_04410 [Kiritimatiellia bacterium]
MGFESGAMTFRCFYLSRAFEPESLELFAKRRLPPLETLTGEQSLHGWTGPSHALDLDFSEEHCCERPYLHFSHVTAEKKIPPSTLRAHLKLELEIERKARDLLFLPRQVKTEVKERVVADLIRHTLPSFGSMECVIDMEGQRLFASAMADRAVELLAPFFRETTGCMPVMMLPESAALRRKNVDVNTLEPGNLSPNEKLPQPVEPTLGLDFFTWLYWFWEKGGGTFQMGKELCGMMFEGPFLFTAADMPGCHETALRNGTPQDSPEFGTALWNGKLLRRAKLTLTRGELIVSAGVDGADFSFRSVKLPKRGKKERPDSADEMPSAAKAAREAAPVQEEEAPVTLFERMRAIDFYVDAFLSLFDQYLDLRANPSAWHGALSELHAWIAHRAGEKL